MKRENEIARWPKSLRKSCYTRVYCFVLINCLLRNLDTFTKFKLVLLIFIWWMCMQACMHVWVCTCNMQTCMSTFCVSLVALYLTLWDRVTHWTQSLLIKLDLMASKLLGCFCICLHGSCITIVCNYIQSFMCMLTTEHMSSCLHHKYFSNWAIFLTSFQNL